MSILQMRKEMKLVFESLYIRVQSCITAVPTACCQNSLFLFLPPQWFSQYRGCTITWRACWNTKCWATPRAPELVGLGHFRL